MRSAYIKDVRRVELMVKTGCTEVCGVEFMETPDDYWLVHHGTAARTFNMYTEHDAEVGALTKVMDWLAGFHRADA